MKNKTVRMILAIAVLAVFCGAYAGVKAGVARQEQQEEESAKASSETLFSADAKDIKSIDFIIDKKETAFEKTGDSWVKQDEKMFPVNQTAIEDAVSAVASIESDRVLKNIENLEEYGLSEPSNTIKITTDKETSDKEATDKETTLRIGDKNSSSNQYYVSKDDDRNTIYLVDSAVVEPFMKNLYDYAEKETFPAVGNTSTVDRIKVSGENAGPYELKKDADTGFWTITSGNENDEIEKADSAKAGSLTSLLGSLTYDAMADYNCTDKSTYGLEKPYAVIEADYQEEAPVPTEQAEETPKAAAEGTTEEKKESDEKPKMTAKKLVITVGSEAPAGGRYVVVNDNNQVYTMTDESLMEFLGKSEPDFWDLTINYLSVNKLKNLKISYKKQTYDINVSRETSKDKDGKESEKLTYLLDGKEAESTNFTAFYNKLVNMAGQSRLTEKFNPASEPEMTAAFTSDDGQNTEVTFYAHDENYYTAVVGEKVYLVNKMTVKDMFAAFEKLTGSNEKTES